MKLETGQRWWELSAAALAGRARQDAPAFDPVERDAFVHWATAEGLAGLLLNSSHGTEAAGWWRDALFEAACRQAARLALQDHEARRVMSALADQGVTPIWLKGAALANIAYPEPWLRPRRDTDLLIREADAPAVRTVFRRLGYHEHPQASGALVTAQFAYDRTDDRAVQHAFDVHRRVVNLLAYADCLRYDDMLARARPIPLLHPGALAASPVDSLILACLHRVAHHQDTDRLIWLVDIHLLARSLADAGWRQALAIARASALSAIVLRGLDRASRALGTPVPDDVLLELGAAARDEPPHPGLDGRTRPLDAVLSDAATLATWKDRVRLLRQHLVPPVAAMRQAYPDRPAALLPLLYLDRVVRGAPRWFRRR